VQYIQTRAAGNPFFAEELARTVGSSSTGGPFIAARHLEHTITALPDTIAAALNLRLSRLSSACQRLLSKAAVLGSSFEFHLISAMEANTPGSSPPIRADNDVASSYESPPGSPAFGQSACKENEDMVLDLLEEAMQA